MAGGSRIIISSEARHLCHLRSNELCQKSVNGKSALRRPSGIASTKKIGAKRRTTTLKFECRDEWLGIRDWGLGVTGILRHRHPERSRGIFTALRESVCMRRGKTMSWCCLISGDERSAIKIEGYARNDDAREALSKLRGASIFLCAAPPPVEPSEPVEPAEPLCTQSRDDTSRGLPPNPEP